MSKIKPYKIDRLYQIVYENLSSDKAKGLNMEKYRSFVSGYGTALIMCDPIKYIKSISDKSNDDIKNEFNLTNVILKALLNENDRKDLICIIDGNQCETIQKLKFKRDIQRYFSVIKEAVYMMYEPSEGDSNGKQ